MKKQVILVTGASSGIGKETTKILINAGHTVYAAARRVEKMNDLKDMGGIPIKMDITNDAEVQAAVDQILDEQQTIDVLINNAGYAIYGAVEDTTIEDAKRQFDVNIFGLASITQKVLPTMRKNKKGKIINVSSMGGKMYTPLGAWYHATKHALEGWSDCLRLELKEFGIDVVIIEPGAIRTEFGDVMTGPMIERSGKGPYSGLTQKLVDASKNAYDDKMSSPPSVIANEMRKAVEAAKPKTRYRAGKFAKPLVWARIYLGDRTFDKIIMSQIK
jgi:short-subunit dehydrogenase